MIAHADRVCATARVAISDFVVMCEDVDVGCKQLAATVAASERLAMYQAEQE